MKRLIVNADDFGMTRGVNRAIEELFEAGTLTSATLMANGMAFDDAVEIAKRHPGLDVGCHVVLVDGSPVIPPADIPTLVERGAPSITFHASFGRFALALYSGQISEDDIEREAVAQISKVQQAGVRVTHLDTHKHTHMLPKVLRPLLRAANARDVRVIRSPFEVRDRTPFGGASLPGLHRGKTPIKRGLQVGILGAMRGTFQRMVRAAGIRTTDGALGIIATGAANFDARLAEILDRLPQGTWELVCHPGYADADLGAVKTRLKASRELEIVALKKRISTENLIRLGVTLADFEDLNPAALPRIKRMHTAGAST